MGERFVAECGVEVPEGEVYVCRDGEEETYWHRYTSRQVAVLQEIVPVVGEGVSHPERGGAFGCDVEETGSGTRLAILRVSVF